MIRGINRNSPAVAATALALTLGVVLPCGAAAQTQVSSFEEIVVKAQRRDERLVDVPISVSSVSEERLQAASVESLVSLPQMVPGLRLDYSGAYVQPTIRGVGSPLAGPGLNSNVAVYFDGYYVPNALASDFQLLSVSSVNVLKGPQGTLFGRNATGGAILINTRDPSFEPTMTARVSYARFNRANVSLYGSAGLTDTLAMDITAFYEEGDGFIRNINTGNKDGEFDKWSVRSKMLYAPNDNVKLTLAYAHTEVDDPMA
ncbi:MAG TPA: TonB-dependent receptor, partial [Sphingomonadales bacterium]